MEALAEALIRQRYAVDIATDGAMAQEFLALFTYDLIMLDMLLPDIRGTALCQQCRQQGIDCPILILTARNTSSDKVQALDAGADDYVIKPFDLDELYARIRALLRRDSHATAATLCWGDLSLRPDTFEVFYRSRQIHTTPKEYALLELFLRQSSRVHSLDTIIENLWSFQDPPSEDAVRTHIKGLRQKLKAVGAPKDLIETVYGVGYRLKPLDEGNSSLATAQTGDGMASTATAPETIAPAPTRLELTTALHNAWDNAKSEMYQRFSLLEAVSAAIASGSLSLELQQAGYRQAHKLAGALGCFGFTEGSRLAQTLERALNPNVNIPGATITDEQSTQIKAAVGQLRAQLIDSTGQIKAVPQPVATSPGATGELWLVDLPNNREAIAAQASAAGLDSRTFDRVDSAHQQLHRQRHRPLAVVIGVQPTSHQAVMDLLAALGDIPAIALTDIQDLHQRLQIVQRGAVRILASTTTPRSVLDTLQQILPVQQPVRLVIVDDDRHVLALLENSLGAWGFQVTTVDNPEQLPQVLVQIDPDVLVLDVDMAGVSGLEICQLLRADERWWRLPILILTVHGEPEVEQQAFRAGADDFVNKSVMVQELPNRIFNRLQRRSFSG